MLKLKAYAIDELVYERKDVLIYRGYNKRKNKKVILKTLPLERVTLKNIENLKYEYDIAQKMNCIEGVIKVYDLENCQSRPVMVMEDFTGSSLKDLVKNKEIKLEEFFEIAIQVVDILNEIHKNKVIHLSINPDNILISNSGEVKIVDFGSAVLITTENKKGKNYNQIEGNLSYISPEQTGRIDREIDYRADYYSLGVCFYQLLTGKLPFDYSDKLELVYAHIAKEAIPPYEVNNKVPEILSNIIMKLIAKMSEDRYQSLTALKRDLEKCQKSFKNKGKIESFEIREDDISDSFQIPKKLYGREKELKELSTSLEEVNKGEKRLVLVKGYAGIGKSALVNEIQNQIVEKSAYFVSGKFEQFQNGIPYSAIIQVVENFVNKLLVQPLEQLVIWREKILQAVGNNGQIIIDVIPSLELIIGKQPLVPKLGVTETKNRFDLVFENFVKAIAKKEHIIVMFIDDLQWADTASLNFIKMLMSNKSIQHLLVIGAYRDNEINLIQPLMIMKNDLIKSNIITKIINLDPIKNNAIQSLLEDTLISSRKPLFNIKELSDFIYKKTKGNPFFVRQFLQSLYDKEYVWFDYDLMQWCWDIEQIKKMDITDNVIELLIKKIKTLSPYTIQDLKYAACIGNKFDLQTLSLINNKSFDCILLDLQSAINEDLISINKNENISSVQDNIRFRFIHDRIQQAVYSMMSDDIKYATHLQVGRLLLKKYQTSEKPEQLFEVVRQYNAGMMMITDNKEKIKLAKMNLKLGIMAKNSSAYNSSFIYLQKGIEMLSCDCWNEYYDLTLQLYSEITETSYLISDFEKMDKFAELVLKNAKKLTDKVKVYNVKIQAYQAQLKLKEALKIGITVLELMGISMPLNPEQTDIDEAFDNVKEAMAGMEVEDLIKLPTMSDPIKLAAMEIMLSTLPTTYKAAPMLTPIITCKMVETSIKYGNSPFSVGTYAFYAMILCGVMNDIEMGYRIGRMSINLVESKNLKQYKAKVLELDNYCIKHWKEHLKSTLDSLMEGFRSGIENGDFEYGAYCLPAHSKNSFYIGRPLEILEEETVKNIKILEEIKQGLSLNYEKIIGQLALNMQGKSRNPIELIGELCDENKMLQVVRDAGDMIGMTFLFLSKTILNYHFGEYHLAIKTSQKTEENLGGVSGMVDIPIHYYFDSLSRLAIYPDVSNNEKEEILTKVFENQSKMKSWSKYAPMNFLHKFYLVEAERLRVIGKCYEAIEYYDKSIFLAKENEYVNDEALANELAAQFWVNKNKYEYAKLHFKEAYRGYNIWGAKAKTNDLKNKYLEIYSEKLEKNIKGIQTTVINSETLDVNTIIKASQTISQEIILDELIKKLIKIVIENIGAQKVVLIMKKEEEFIIKGNKEIEEDIITINQDIMVDESESIPKNIINYVSRKKESVILKNSINSINFGCDTYILKTKPKSILCFPLINQGEVKGIIYLENNLMTGAFTKERLEVLKILSSQIVISLENANLYKNLEYSNEKLDIKVKERTEQLKKERDKLQKYLDISEVVFLILNQQGQIAMINKKGCNVLGYDEHEIIGKDLFDNYIKEERRDKLEEVFDRKVVNQVEATMITRTGEERKFISHNAILEDEEGNIEGVLISALDITERELLKEELEYNKLKVDFFANLSHELRTPLNLSFSALQMINLYRNKNLNSEANEKLETYTNIIRQNNYRLLKLVNNLVDITKINSNSFDLNLQNYDIVDIVKKITYSVEDYTRNKNRILEFNSNIKSKIIACDPFCIERIILNILSNAIKFTDKGDKISVSVCNNEESISIIIKDTGIGIPQDKHKFIFERFRQVDKSFTRNSEGSGIGLTIAKLLVELHHGEIKVNSNVDEFSEFIIELPIKELDEEDIFISNYSDDETRLIERIDIEFSDVYGL